ncbi:MAG TPA: nitric oxide reductase activation protein, partial [Mycobacteriales bacterium]|nr:nitric oxide reductase activation protein [Mycobacteriales bacterium]
EHQREAAAVLAEAFHAFGNRVAVHGFYSQGRSAVRFVRVKRFADPLDGRAHARLGALTAGAYTRLGAAIRHGSAVLESDGAGSRRLLIVLSDGFAYDQGYQGRYGEADARRALAEARRRGIGCLCLSVGATTDLVALRRVFGTAAHAAVRRSDDLGRMIGPLVRDALASAELQRRRTWRIERRAA